MKDKFEVTFLGTNGSCTYNGGNREKYGTNTLCIAVLAGEETLIFDSGSGICSFHKLQDYQRNRIRLLYSHYHLDHFNGLLFFPELFDKQKQVDLYGANFEEKSLHDVVNDFLALPLHPVGINDMKAQLTFNTIKAGDVITLDGGVKIHTYSLSHPGGSVAYRVEFMGKAFCYCTDVELQKHENDSKLLEFIRHADLVVFDSFFDDGNVLDCWGHSSWKECAQWAKQADVKKMALFHYGFMLCDAEITTMEEKAKKIFPNTFASADNMRVEL